MVPCALVLASPCGPSHLAQVVLNGVSGLRRRARHKGRRVRVQARGHHFAVYVRFGVAWVRVVWVVGHRLMIKAFVPNGGAACIQSVFLGGARTDSTGLQGTHREQQCSAQAPAAKLRGLRFAPALPSRPLQQQLAPAFSWPSAALVQRACNLGRRKVPVLGAHASVPRPSRLQQRVVAHHGAVQLELGGHRQPGLRKLQQVCLRTASAV